MTIDDRVARLSRLAPLLDPIRRRLYDHVVAQHEPVGRDATAASLGVSRRLVAFHLDKLVDAGLLAASYRRLTGRAGPGAGRPAKLYARPDEEIAVTVPPRDYELAARVFIGAVAGLGDDARAALEQSATAAGHQLAARVQPTTDDNEPAAVQALLEKVGYGPYRAGGVLRMRNCPFHRLAESHRELVCSANSHMLRAAVAQVSAAAEVELVPSPGECCVQVRTG